MPWTVAHTAAIIPFNGFKKLSLLGLAIGSMAPDIGYYIKQNELATASHSVIGAFFICVPLGSLTTWFLWNHKAFFLDPLPSRIKTCISSFAASSRPKPLWLAVSVFIGAMTHVFWDAFTHKTGYMVQEFPLLQRDVGFFLGRQNYVYHLLQHSSTLFGVFFLSLYAGRKIFMTDKRLLLKDPKLWVIFSLLCFGGVLGLFFTLIMFWKGLAPSSLYALFVQSVIHTSSFIMAGYLCICLWHCRFAENEGIGDLKP